VPKHFDYVHQNPDVRCAVHVWACFAPNCFFWLELSIRKKKRKGQKAPPVCLICDVPPESEEDCNGFCRSAAAMAAQSKEKDTSATGVDALSLFVGARF
jgi:hypothetical protein